MEIGLLFSGIRTAFGGVLAALRIKSALKAPRVTIFFSVGEGFGYSTPLSRKHFLDELKSLDRSDRWLEINIEIANGQQSDTSIQQMSIHAGRSPFPIKNVTFGGKVLPHRLLVNQTERWSVSVKELTEGLNIFPTDFGNWPNLNLVVKLGNGRTVRAHRGISKKEWAAVLEAWAGSTP